MRALLVWRVAAAVVIVGVGAAGYALWIPEHHPNPQREAALAVTRPVAGFKAKPQTGTTTPASSPLAAVDRAATATPGQTGGETVVWSGTSKKAVATLSVVALPTTADARAATTEADTAYLSQTSLTTDGYGYGGKLELAAVPGASGVEFIAGTTPTPTPTTRHADVEVFREGRVVAVVSVEDLPAKAKSAVDALAVREYRHLRTDGGAPTLAETSFPVVATVVYAAVVAAALAAAELAPTAIAGWRRRRQAAWEEALRRERASRGSKVVKRRAGRTPPRSTRSTRTRARR